MWLRFNFRGQGANLKVESLTDLSRTWKINSHKTRGAGAGRFPGKFWGFCQPNVYCVYA